MVRKILQNFPHGRWASGGSEYIIICPSCGKDDHFYINTETGKAYCHRCHFTCSNPKDLLRVLGITGTSGTLRYELQSVTGFDPSMDTVSLLSDEGLPGLIYLHRRGITDEQIKEYGLSLCIGGKYADRVIFPVFNTKQTPVSFIARTIYDDVPAKYMNKPGTKLVPFNLNKAHRYNSVVIMEGPMDVLCSKLPNAVALAGKSISRTFAMQIKSNFETAIVWLDKGEVENQDAVEIAKVLNSYGMEVFIVFQQEGSDPGDCPNHAMEIGRKIKYNNKLYYKIRR